MTYRDIAKGITNIRYLEDFRIGFDFAGATHTFSDPGEVILVGVPGSAPAEWIAKRYGLMLAVLVD